jgi:hypothetical protein
MPYFLPIPYAYYYTQSKTTIHNHNRPTMADPAAMTVMTKATANIPHMSPTIPRRSTFILLGSSVTQKRSILALIHMLCLMLSTADGIPPCSSSPTVADDVIAAVPLLPPSIYRTRSSLFGV